MAGVRWADLMSINRPNIVHRSGDLISVEPAETEPKKQEADVPAPRAGPTIILNNNNDSNDESWRLVLV